MFTKRYKKLIFNWNEVNKNSAKKHNDENEVFPVNVSTKLIFSVSIFLFSPFQAFERLLQDIWKYVLYLSCRAKSK